jgi:CubicO group peptidase (beta-lactamase class C family)
VTLDLAAVDELFARDFERGRSPGVVYAVVRDGEVLHWRGLGTTTPSAPDATPTDTSVQRIASMSKSFTATAVLMLRDRGRLRLDDLVSAYVDDAPDGVTLRHLLTMSGGLLTDDPWGDRLEPQTPEELRALLADGITVGGPPGVGFEYSNLGYALLGLVVDAVLGEDGGFRAFVLEEVTGPLAMTATAYDARTVGDALVTGHHDHGDGWAAEPLVVPGTFSAMGGLHSSVRDLARWVGGFTDAFRHPDAPHPLSAASRREMQQLQRFASVSASLSDATTTATGYGAGLIVEHHSDHGHVVQHSGGYPGYGSHMRWHPETGLGVVALANGTYAGPSEAARDALRALVLSSRTAPVVSRVVTPELVAALTATITAADPYAGGLFSANVAQDVPLDVRRRKLGEALEAAGRPTGPATAPHTQGLGTARWSVPTERGRLDVTVKVAPTASQPAVQSLEVVAVPEAPADLVQAATAALDSPAAVLARAYSSEAAIAGTVAGGGETTATFAVRVGATWWKLVVARDAEPELTAYATGEWTLLEHRFGEG